MRKVKFWYRHKIKQTRKAKEKYTNVSGKNIVALVGVRTYGQLRVYILYICVHTYLCT